MPRTPSMDEYIVNSMDKELDSRAAAIAGHLGRPPGAEDLSEKDQLRLWNLRLPTDFQQIVSAPDPQTAQQILAAAQHPYPDRVLELLGQGLVEEAATLVEYPFREVLYTAGRLEQPRAQVEYADKMANTSQGYLNDKAEQMLAAGGGIQPAPEATGAEL